MPIIGNFPTGGGSGSGGLTLAAVCWKSLCQMD